VSKQVKTINMSKMTMSRRRQIYTN